MTSFFRIASLVALLALAACKRDDGDVAGTTTPATTPPPVATTPAPTPPPAPTPAVTIANIELGNAVGPDNRITTPTMTFAPADTIYAAVSTNGSAPTTTITARWTKDGQLVNESSETIAPTGPAVTTFNIAKPDGWPAGKYKVEVLIDGQSVGQREFDVTA